MGTPDFAVAALEAIAKSSHEIICVYTQPPRPAGRGHEIKLSAVHARANALDIPVRTPTSLKKDAAARAEFAALDADIAIVAAYGLILPQEVLDAPKYGCINIHASLLPRWRGAAPIQRAIMAGDAESGISIMQMEAGLDTGPVLAMEKTPITEKTTAQSLHDKLSQMGARMIVQTLDQIAAGKTPSPQKQNDASATYAAMLTKEDGKIDWAKPAAEIERQLRALHPWPGVWCMHKGQRLKILEAVVTDIKDLPLSPAPGKIMTREMIVASGSGFLHLKKVQPENRKAMDGTSYMNGLHLTVGEMLE